MSLSRFQSPSSNTGVTKDDKNTSKALQGEASSDLAQNQNLAGFDLSNYAFGVAKFDWFAGSVKGVIKYHDQKNKPVYERINPQEYLDRVIQHLGDNGIQIDYVHDTAVLGRFINKKKLYVCQNYGYAYHLFKDGESLLSISYGGHNGKESVYLSTTGQSCSMVFERLRECWYNLKATRVDACYDTNQDYIKLKYKLTRYCRENGIKYRVDGQGVDENGNRTGETLYIDLTASKRIRVYEKGYERKAQYPDADIPLDWVRFEIEVKGDVANHEDGQIVLSQSSPEDLLTIDKHCTALFNRFTGTKRSPSMLQLNTKKQTDHDKAIQHLADQYGNVLRKQLETPEGFIELVSRLGLSESEDCPEWLSRFLLMHGYHSNDFHAPEQLKH